MLFFQTCNVINEELLSKDIPWDRGKHRSYLLNNVTRLIYQLLLIEMWVY